MGKTIKSHQYDGMKRIKPLKPSKSKKNKDFIAYQSDNEDDDMHYQYDDDGDYPQDNG